MRWRGPTGLLVLAVGCGSGDRIESGPELQDEGVSATPVERAVLVRVRPKAVEMAGTAVASLTEGRLDEEVAAEKLLFPLERVLRDEVDQGRARALSLELDPATTYRTLFELVRTAERAGVDTFELKLVGGDGATHEVGLPAVLRAAIPPGSEEDLQPVMSMELEREQLSISVAGHTEVQPRSFRGGDLPQLRAAAHEMMEANSGMHRLVLSAQPGLSARRLFAVLEALQGRSCLSGSKEACVLDPVELLGGKAHLYDPARHGVLRSLAHAEYDWEGFSDPEIAKGFGLSASDLGGGGTNDALDGYSGRTQSGL